MNLFANENLRWKHHRGNDKFDYPIDFSSALLGARDDGHVDLLLSLGAQQLLPFSPAQRIGGAGGGTAC